MKKRLIKISLLVSILMVCFSILYVISYAEDPVKPYKIYLKTGTLEPGNQAGTDDGNIVGNEEQVYIIAFTGPVTVEMKKSAEEAGAKMLGYLPDFAFIALISPDAVPKVKDLECVAALLPFKPEYKIDPELPSNSSSDEDIDITIAMFDIDLSQLKDEIAKDKAVIIYELKDSIRLKTKVKYISDFSKVKAVEYIEKYHEMYIEPRPTVGDFNGDGKVNSADISIFKRIILGIYTGNYNHAAADINGDGKINSTDYSLLKRDILGR